MEKSTFEQIQELVKEYNKKLEPYGIYCKVNRHNVTSPVSSLHISSDIFDVIYNTIMKKREKKHFHNTPNKYKVIGLCISPIENGIISKRDCKQYAYIIESIDRYEEGYTPKHKIHKTEKTFKKITKRLEKVLIKSKKETNVNWCKNNILDALRYGFGIKYNYIETNILGISIDNWSLIIVAVILSIIIFLCFIVIKPIL